LPLALTFALRELRSGIAGFRIFLGVSAMAAAGSTAEAFRQGLAAQSRELLGGDIRIRIEGRGFTPGERAAFERQGQTVYSAATRAMAESGKGERRLVELRGVGPGYPLVGRLELKGAPDLATVFGRRDGLVGVAVEQTLMDRLGLQLGQDLRIGNGRFAVRAILVSEPDRLAGGFGLGPRVLAPLQTLRDTGMLDPNLPGYDEAARIRLPNGRPADPVIGSLNKELGDGELDIKGREDAASGARKLIDQLEYFLGFIGLTSLIAGGLGVFGAVSAFLEGRRGSIATLKALGADSRLIRDTYLLQILALTALGLVIGLVIGTCAPLILGFLARDNLPVPALFAIYPLPLFKAAAAGLLSALAFSLVPLARARATPPSSLFRREMTGQPAPGPELVGAILCAILLVVLAISTAPTPVAAAIMLAGVSLAFGLLWALGLGGVQLAARLRPLSRGAVRLGLANLAGPRSAARTASASIGLGIALLGSVVLIQSSLLAQISKVAPKTAPAMVFTEIPGDRVEAFDQVVTQAFATPLTPDNYLRAPFATGRIIRIKDQPVDLTRIAESEHWAYDNDIALSAIGSEPQDAGIVEGHWWPSHYLGPPLIALEAQAAAGAGLKVGDSVTLSILGRGIDARIAVLRKVEWGGFGPSFALIINPSALEGANLHEVAIARANQIQEERVTRALGINFAEVNVISVREQLEAATGLFDRLALAIRGAASVAALAGLLVLVGAIAAGARSRIKEVATLKVLGASSPQIIMAYGIEFGLVGLISGLAGVGLAYLAAWPVVVRVFEATWNVNWTELIALTLGATLVALIGGLAAALHALTQPVAGVLRAE